MKIALFVHEDTADAVVTNSEGQPIERVMVAFYANGNSICEPVMTGTNGIASIGLDLPIGKHEIQVHIATSPGIAAKANHTMKAVTRQLVGKVGGLIMVIYWLVIWLTGPRLFIATCLALAMTILLFKGGLSLTGCWKNFWSNDHERKEKFEAFSIFFREGSRFNALIRNNNWVFGTTLAMAFTSMVAWGLNPLHPRGLLQRAFSLGSVTNPFEGQGFWANLNHFFFGEYSTYGWRGATMFFVLCVFASIPISYHDELVRWLKKRRSQGKGGFFGETILKILAKDLFAESVFKFFGRGK